MIRCGQERYWNQPFNKLKKFDSKYSRNNKITQILSNNRGIICFNEEYKHIFHMSRIIKIYDQLFIYLGKLHSNIFYKRLNE